MTVPGEFIHSNPKQQSHSNDPFHLLAKNLSLVPRSHYGLSTSSTLNALDKNKVQCPYDNPFSCHHPSPKNLLRKGKWERRGQLYQPREAGARGSDSTRVCSKPRRLSRPHISLRKSSQCDQY